MWTMGWGNWAIAVGVLLALYIRGLWELCTLAKFACAGNSDLAVTEGNGRLRSRKNGDVW